MNGLSNLINFPQDVYNQLKKISLRKNQISAKFQSQRVDEHLSNEFTGKFCDKKKTFWIIFQSSERSTIDLMKINLMKCKKLRSRRIVEIQASLNDEFDQKPEMERGK
jgi:hypothetical protein